MPELPDVEAYRGVLERHAAGREIASVRVGDERVLRGVSPRALRDRLRGRRLGRSVRRGKHLLAEVEGDGWLALHFGMTGDLAPFADAEEPSRHARVTIGFAGGGGLAFLDQRLFGAVGLAKDPQAFFAARGLGPDALEIGFDDFDDILLAHRGTRLKQLLMDQSLVAGLGNIYADEVLFHAGLHPLTTAGSLGVADRRRLFEVMHGVLRRAVSVRAGSTPEPADWLLHHRSAGDICPGGGSVERLKVAGRSTYFCPRRQHAPSG